MAVKVIPLRMNSEFPFERDFIQRYESMPRSRRIQWIRLVLQLGLDAFEGAPAAVAPAARSVGDSADVLEFREARPTAQPQLVPQPSSDAQAANEPASKALCGFFG